MILQLGSILNQRYRIEKFIGSGGMAEVYKAWDTQRAAFLALKLLNADLAEDLVFFRRFQREAQALQNLSHPHIVQFYDLVEADHLVFLLMAFVEGMTLKTEIFQRRSPYPAERILEIFRPLCSALFYAHNQGYIHCDVKPANIMIESSGKVLLTDFGISRLSDTLTTATAFRSAGTPAYMAPELVQGLRPRPATDVYSLGIMLYELLSGGERPFTGETAQITGSPEEKVRWEQVNQPPPPIRPYNPQISPDVEQVMLRCLAKDPAERFATTQELMRALEKAYGEDERTNYEVPGLATAQMPPGFEQAVPQPIFKPTHPSLAFSIPSVPSDEVRFPPQPIQKSFPRGLWLTILLGCVFIILMIGGIWLFRPGDTLLEATLTVLPTVSNATKQISPTIEVSPTPRRTLTNVIATSTSITSTPRKSYPRGLIAFENGSDETDQIFLHDPVSRRTWKLEGQPRNCLVPSFSWDGLTMLIRCAPYGNNQYQIFSIPTDGGTATQLTKEGNNMEAVFSPDGKRIAFVKQTEEFVKNIFIMDSSGRNIRAITNDRYWNDDPQFSPDGRLLSFESTRSDKKCPGCSEIFIVNPDSPSQVTMVTGYLGVENFTPDWSPDGQSLVFECRLNMATIIHLCTIHRDGSGAKQITYGKGEGRPAWSPDGQEIVYTQDEPDGSVTVNILALDNSHPPILIQAGYDPAWSLPITP